MSFMHKSAAKHRYYRNLLHNTRGTSYHELPSDQHFCIGASDMFLAYGFLVSEECKLGVGCKLCCLFRCTVARLQRAPTSTSLQPAVPAALQSIPPANPSANACAPNLSIKAARKLRPQTPPATAAGDPTRKLHTQLCQQSFPRRCTRCLPQQCSCKPCKTQVPLDASSLCEACLKMPLSGGNEGHRCMNTFKGSSQFCCPCFSLQAAGGLPPFF